MEASNFNIKQITNFDLLNSPTTNYQIDFPEETKTIQYVDAINNINVAKFGYCCEIKGIGYPIFVETNDGKGYRKIEIGKTGIYEMQPEVWQDLNDINIEPEKTSIIITGIRVPKDISFVLDYVLLIN